MATELYVQARKLQKLFPDWKFTSIVKELNRSQFSSDSFHNLNQIVQSKLKSKIARKKRKHTCENEDMRKKICTARDNLKTGPCLNAVDLTTASNDSVIVLSSDDSIDSTDSSVIIDDPINVNLIKENLLSIFPECEPLYIEFLITLAKESIPNENLLVDHIVSRLISENYPKSNDDDTLAIPDIIQTVQEPFDILPKLVENTSQSLDNDKKFPVPDLLASENASTIQESSNNLLNERIQGVIEESFDKTSTDFEALPDNPNNISIENENVPNSLQSLSDYNELNELLNDEVETNEFMKLFAELEKLSNIPLPSEDISNIPLPPSENISKKPLPSEDMKKFVPVVEYNQIHKPASHKTATEDIKPTIKTEKLEKMNEMNEMENAANVDNLVLKLLPIFPDACPNFLRDFCRGRKNNPTELEQIIMYLITNDFPKRARVQDNAAEQEVVNEEEQYQIMLELLPDADPDYLRVHCSNLYDKPDQLKGFIDDALERKNYPTLKDYKRKQQLSAQMKQYTTEFNVNKFLESIPNPVEYFNDEKRVCTYNSPNRMNYDKLIAIEAHMKDVFKNLFLNKRVADINAIIRKNQKRVILIYNELKNGKIEDMKRNRKLGPVQQLYGEIDVPYMQEIAYITHYDEIHRVLKQREQEKTQLFEFAKANGTLLTCECCFDDEVMEDDTFTCDYGHKFCKTCIIRSVEISFGENKLQYTCLTNCKAEFSLATLQKLLKPNMFSKIALRKQIEEVKSAGIEDLESCPFCDFATIPTPGDKIFKCLNEECLKESCRNCKELSHIPYRCDEIEKNDEVKARTYIEDKMTEALLRKCWKCGMKFIKEDGCNKMTCRCGAFMCYVCGKPVDGYKHFNGQGGTNYELCPLYSDTEKLHLDAVRKIGEEAKQEIKQKNPAVQLKHDPLTGLPKAKAKDTVYKPGPQYDPFQGQHRGPHNNNVRHHHQHHVVINLENNPANVLYDHYHNGQRIHHNQLRHQAGNNVHIDLDNLVRHLAQAGNNIMNRRH